jgi:hypothetical protein
MQPCIQNQKKDEIDPKRRIGESDDEIDPIVKGSRSSVDHWISQENAKRRSQDLSEILKYMTVEKDHFRGKLGAGQRQN